MIAKEIREKYLPTIGIECHVQLSTDTKLFAAVANDARGQEPNTTVSPICFGLPGSLPMLNKKAVQYAIRAGLALNAEIASNMKFDRKHYFYPDLPKGYQITQYDQPVIREGYIEVPMGDEMVKVRIERAHLEEDAGKSTHPAGTDFSLVDLNRAGTPLLEIVSYPDIHSAAVAKGYAQELYNLIKYAEVSDVDLFQGNMRFDVNVSVAPVDSSELGTRSEVKNLNSFKSIEKATQYEIDRQIEIIEKGQQVVQETRGWEEAKQKTVAQRSKEEAHDYRYFPDPDLPPVTITQEEINTEKRVLPNLPPQLRKKFAAAGVNKNQIELIINNKPLAEIAVVVMNEANKEQLSRIINWLSVDVMGYINAHEDFNWSDSKLQVQELIALARMVEEGKLSSTGASAVVVELLTAGGSANDIASNKNLLQISDTSMLEDIVTEVLTENPKATDDLKSGETKAIGFLIGQVMQKSRGQANPQVARELILQKLEDK